MSTYSEALASAAAYCSKGEKCRSEVCAHLKRFELSADEMQRLLGDLEKEGYLDERRYARAFASDRFRFQHWGRLKIRHALCLKSVPSAVAEAALEVISEEDYMAELRRTLMEKIKTTKKGLDGAQWAAKIIRHALSRGFEAEAVRRCLAEIAPECADGAEEP